MIEIYDLRRNKVAAAENALAVSETKRLNSINSLSFTLPANDPKNEFCNPYWYVRSNGGDLYRIMPNSMKFDDDKGLCEYQCEHVLATLIDKIMYDWHVATGTTAECIQYCCKHFFPSQHRSQRRISGEQIPAFTLGDCRSSACKQPDPPRYISATPTT